MPGPLKDSIELLFALSKEALKIQFIFNLSVTSLNFSATKRAVSSDSRTFIPPIKVKS